MSQSFKRGLMILDLFSLDRPRLTLEEIAYEVKISPITAYRYVKVLCDSGMLVMKDGHVQLSARILRFVNLFWQQDRLIEIAQEKIDLLHDEFNETIALCKIEEKDVICIYKLESSLMLRSSFSIGQRMSIHAGAFARSIAAFLPDKELKAIMDNIDWRPFTEHTIVTPEEFKQRLSEIRKRGYDISKEEVNYGVVAIAVPIKRKNERAIASLGLAMPSVRHDTANMTAMVKKLQETAETISKEIQNDPLFMMM